MSREGAKMHRWHMKTLLGALVLLGLSSCAGLFYEEGNAAAPDTSRAPPLAHVGTKPLKVYIMAGQSNMQGHCRAHTLEHMGMDPVTVPILEKIQSADGSFKVYKDVWMSTLGCAPSEKTGNLSVGFGASRAGPKIGPELTFGIYMYEHLKEPMLIIKTAWGGKSLFLDFRPPSAGPYDVSPDLDPGFKHKGTTREEVVKQRREVSGHYYRMMMEHVKMVLADIKRVYPDYDPEHGYEVAGFVWFQGCNDFGDAWTYPKPGEPGGFDEYSRLLGCLIRDIRRELDAPTMKAVIGVLGINGELETKRYRNIEPEHLPWLHVFRKAMAAPASSPEFRGTVAAVHTEEFWEPRLEELQSRWKKLKAKSGELKKLKLGRDEHKKRMDAFIKTVYNDEEWKLMCVGVSNAAYHYLGSAKIMARIGKAFAEAMIGLPGSGPATGRGISQGGRWMSATPTRVERETFPGEKSLFENRFAMYRDGGNIVVVPDEVAPGKPWVWRARFWRHEPQFDLAMLERGYHVVYCGVGGLLGNPTAVERWNDYYRFLVEERGFAPKAVLEGMSRGGMIIYNWAIANPEKVAAIYGDAPVMDLRSWPGFKSGMLRRAYRFESEDEFDAWKGNPVDNLKPLADAGIPIIHVVGDKDDCVLVSEHTAVAERRYREMGGVIEVIHKKDCGHHPHSLEDPAPIVAFVEKYVERKRR